MNMVSNVRKSKNARVLIIGGLFVLVVILGFMFESLRAWMIGVGVVLLIALGFEFADTDVDLGSVMDGNSISESVIERDEVGNLESSEDGGFLTRVLLDREGNEVPEGTAGAKYADEYNCDDFDTQPEAQRFFENAGGVDNDINRLDGNNDGIACQALPAN